MPCQPVTLPPGPVREISEIVHGVIPPDLSTPTTELSRLESSDDDNPGENQDIQDVNSPHTEKDRASSPMLNVRQEE
ncbi:Queuine tRNA-ribosyltransferase [Clarias magur]|uniref:Queuine tRNA-ribosyltransferase n=1 Tax=Clarias magur TaxID=1594786 RepID=A0A8J4U5D0_CLAMG|nr:Queuine tRNA-ribosyltransferase [Clarias magur]